MLNPYIRQCFGASAQGEHLCPPLLLPSGEKLQPFVSEIEKTVQNKEKRENQSVLCLIFVEWTFAVTVNQQNKWVMEESGFFLHLFFLFFSQKAKEKLL